MKTPVKISLDEIMSKRAFSVRQTKNGEALTKLYQAPASFKSTDDGARSADFVMTAEVEDRYGDIVVTKGGDIKEFQRNPVVLWAHQSRGFPIGMWSNIRTINGSPRRMEGTADFAPAGIDENGDKAVALIEAGMLRACSIGFMPKAWESIKDDNDRWKGYKFLEWELLECSVCSVPANPAAIVKSAGGDEGLALQAIELVLDEWARTPDGLIVPREEYEKAYVATRNKDVSIHEVRAIEDADTEEDTVVEEKNGNQTITIKVVAGGVEEPTIMARVKELVASMLKDKPTTKDPVGDVITVEDVEEETKTAETATESTSNEEEDANRQKELALRALALEAELDDEIPA